MCRRTTCRTCGKPGWAGCGAHVEMVLADVPAGDRCRCAEDRAAHRASQRTEGGGRAEGARGSLLQRILGR